MAPRISGKTSRKKKSAVKKAAKQAMKPDVPLAHRLHALLHTVRAIAQAEEELCTLLHAVEHAAEVRRELDGVLLRMPVEDYVADLDAVRDLLRTPGKPAGMVKKRAAKSARKAARLKNAQAA